MKTKMCGILLALLALGATVEATCPVVVRHRAIVHQQVIAVAVPYSVAYGSPSSGELQQLLQEIQKLRQEVQQLRGGPQVLQQKASLLQQHCAACHSDGGAKGGLGLFKAGQRLELAPEKLGDCLSAVLEGRMPKNAKLTDAQKVALSRELMGK